MLKAPNEVITSVPSALELFEQESTLGFDLETSGLHFQRDEIAVVSLYGPKTKRAAILHVQGAVPPALIEFLSSPRTFIGHNIAAFDLLFLARLGVDLDTPTWYDSLIAEAIALTSARKDLRVSLKAAVKRRLNIDLEKDAGGHTWMSAKLTLEQIQYCVEDVLHLARLQKAQLKAMGPEQVRALEFEHRLLPILVRMALRGLPLDYSRVGEYERARHREAADAADLIAATLGAVNLASPVQIVRGVRDALGYALPATTAEALGTMAGEPGDVGRVGRALRLSKSAASGGVAYGLEDQSFAGSIYPRYRQVNRDDGRLEVAEPDLTKLPEVARALFGGVPDHVLVSVRHMNLWWATMAYLARDSAMREIAHLPLAGAFARVLWPIQEQDLRVQQEMAACARALAQAALFGHPPAKLERALRLLGQDPAQAPALLALFAHRFPALAKLHAQAANQARLAAVPVTFPTGMRRVIAKAQPWEITSLRAKGTVGALIKQTVWQAAQAGLDECLRAVVGEELLFLVPQPVPPGWMDRLGEAGHAAQEAVWGFRVPVECRSHSHWGMM